MSPAMDSSEAAEAAGCGGDAFPASDAAPGTRMGKAEIARTSGQPTTRQYMASGLQTH